MEEDQSSSRSSSPSTFPEDVVGAETEICPGLTKTILVAGRGYEKPGNGANVDVHYVGTLTDGTKFDASRDRNKHFSFTLGKNSVIQGWELGVATMRLGEKSLFKIAPELAYGAAGSPPTIPANATLHFEVELLHFSSETDITYGKKTVMKRTLVPGKDWKTPGDFSRVTVVFEITEDKKKIAESASEAGDVFVLNEDEAFSGFETAVRSLKEGEKAVFKIAASETKADPLCKIQGLSPNGAANGLTLTAQLVAFENPRDSWELNNAEKIAEGETMKQRGNDAFKAGRFGNALFKYNRALDFLRGVREPDEEEPDAEKKQRESKEKEQSEQLMTALHLNVAATQLKRKQYAEAVSACNDALRIDNRNIKARYRRAEAHRGKGDFELAVRDLQTLLELDADNQDAKQLLAVAQREQRQVEKKMENMYSKMIGAL